MSMYQVPGNKMDSSNLATVFGPNVLRQGKTGKFQMDGMDQMAQNDDVIAVVKDLIDFHAAVFRVRLSFKLHSLCLPLYGCFIVFRTRTRPNSVC